MPLINFEVNKEPEVDDAIVVKADDGKERVIMEIPRTALEDCFELRSATPKQRLARVNDNIDAIARTMKRKYQDGWTLERRSESKVRRVADATEQDLRDALA